MENASCGKCKLEWNGRDEMCPCSGVCKSTFHLRCAGINTTTYNQLMKSKQLRWFCTACSEITIVAVFQKLDELTCNMVKIFESFSVMNDFMKASIDAQRLSAQSLQLQVPANSSTNLQHKNNNSTPVVIGIGAATTSLQSVNVPDNDVLYVSRLSPHTEEAALIDYLKSKLDNLDVVDCRLLLPKGRVKTDLTFISFKLTLDRSLSSQVLSPIFWPKGVLVRRFVRKTVGSKNGDGVILPRVVNDDHVHGNWT